MVYYPAFVGLSPAALNRLCTANNAKLTANAGSVEPVDWKFQ